MIHSTTYFQNMLFRLNIMIIRVSKYHRGFFFFLSLTFSINFNGSSNVCTQWASFINIFVILCANVQ